MRRLFGPRLSERDRMELDLVARAAEVAAAAASARKALKGLHEELEGQKLLGECVELERAAGDLLDPRSQLLDGPTTDIGHALDMFFDYQLAAAVLRTKVLKLARMRP
jgi:hypothetical protein